MNPDNMTISEWKLWKAEQIEKERIAKIARTYELGMEADELIEASNLLIDKYSDHPKFEEADRYLASKIQMKLGEVTGMDDTVEWTIGVVCRTLGITEEEFYKQEETND